PVAPEHAARAITSPRRRREAARRQGLTVRVVIVRVLRFEAGASGPGGPVLAPPDGPRTAAVPSVRDGTRPHGPTMHKFSSATRSRSGVDATGWHVPGTRPR